MPWLAVGYFRKNQFYKMNSLLFCFKLWPTPPPVLPGETETVAEPQSSHRELTKTICSELKDTVEEKALQASTHTVKHSGMPGILFQSPPHPSISAVTALSKCRPQRVKHWSFSWSCCCPLQTPPWKSPPKISPSLGLFQTMTLGHMIPLVSSWVPPRSTLLSLNLALLCQFD